MGLKPVGVFQAGLASLLVVVVIALSLATEGDGLPLPSPDVEYRGGDSSELYDNDDVAEQRDRVINGVKPPNGETNGETEGVKNGVSVYFVAFNTLVMALAAGLGAVPFFLVKEIDKRWLGTANAFASGVMLAASFGLIAEGLEGARENHGILIRLLGGMILGVVFIIVSQQMFDDDSVSFGKLHGMDAKKAIMVLAIMTLHAFSEGLGVGVSYGGDKGGQQGVATTWAIGIHNIPEGLAVAMVAVPRGESKWKAAGYAVFSSLPQPIVAIPAFLFVKFFEFLLPIGLGAAAGSMIWMIFAELIPDAMKHSESHNVATTLSLAMIGQIMFQTLLGM